MLRFIIWRLIDVRVACIHLLKLGSDGNFNLLFGNTTSNLHVSKC